VNVINDRVCRYRGFERPFACVYRGKHSSNSVRDGPLTIPPSGRPDPVTISNPLRSPGLPADRNEHLGRVSSDHPNAAVMDDVLPECRLVGKLVGPFDAVG
jgi:hypothetical protein